MKVFSYFKERQNLSPVEVELSLVPGLPGIHFLGLPGPHLKESSLRIKSAIKQQGFRFPKAQQILVNLRPSHVKKESRGLELAVAAAYLWKTQQVAQPLLGKDVFIYGELNLSGEVFEPDDLELIEAHLQENQIVLTGKGGGARKFRRLCLPELKNLALPTELLAVESGGSTWLRPELAKNFKLSSQQAEIIKILALGSHSALLAGASGSGKSTLAKCLHALLPEPSSAEWQSILLTQKKFAQQPTWRPLVKPHHSIPLMAMVGGGAIPMAGEISRAHGGLLLMDEFLEYTPRVQEALREPFEEGAIQVARQGRLEVFKADGQFLGTTNLCPCGDASPEKGASRSCRFSRRKCRSYSQRLSGPLLDRFDLLIFLSNLGSADLPWLEVREAIDRAYLFRQKRQGGEALSLSKSQMAQQIESELGPASRRIISELRGSERRKVATLCVARSLADLRQDLRVSFEDLDRALEWTYRSFEKMRTWDFDN